MRKINRRQAERLMKQMGMRQEDLPDAKQVIIKTESKDIIIDNPNVSITHMGEQKIFQIIGGNISEKHEEKRKIPEEDIQIVAEQATVSTEKARKALEEVDGDLAKAILRLTTEKGN